MLSVGLPADVVLSAAVVMDVVLSTGAAVDTFVVDSLACPTHVPTLPTLSTAASTTFCEQQEAL